MNTMTAANETPRIKLIGGYAHAVPTESLQVGDETIWNFGMTSVVTKVERVSACYFAVTTESDSGEFTRRMKVGRLVGITTATMKKRQAEVAARAEGKAPTFTPKSSNHYAVTARVVRAAGYKCAFRCGEVFVWKTGASSCWFTAIDGGRWMNHGDLGQAPWLVGDLDTVRAPGWARLVERDCYCSSFPDTGCDFCQGVRSCDGEGA